MPMRAGPSDLGYEEELTRVTLLREYGVLDQPRQPELDALARLAAHVCGLPVAAVNLIDTKRQWQAAAYGCEPREVVRENSLSARSVFDPDAADVIHVRDASLDPHLADNPYVNGAIEHVGRYAAAPLRTPSGLVLGSLSVPSPEPGALTEEQLEFLRVLADQVMNTFELRRTTAALGRLAATDPLTGLANRRSVEMAIGSAIRRAERGLGTPSVAIVDLDGFKAFNESSGSAAGDVLLKEVAERLTRTARSVDMVARLGGDGFVVLLEHTGGSGAVAAVDRLRRALAETSRVAGQIEASAGYATYRPGDSPVSLLARADAEMYGEKVRNRA